MLLWVSLAPAKQPANDRTGAVTDASRVQGSCAPAGIGRATALPRRAYLGQRHTGNGSGCEAFCPGCLGKLCTGSAARVALRSSEARHKAQPICPTLNGCGGKLCPPRGFPAGHNAAGDDPRRNPFNDREPYMGRIRVDHCVVVTEGNPHGTPPLEYIKYTVVVPWGFPWPSRLTVINRDSSRAAEPVQSCPGESA